MRQTAGLTGLAGTLLPLACFELPTEPRRVEPPVVAPPVVEPPAVADLPATATIAFVRDRIGFSHIYLANADGTGVTCVAEGSAPAWSRDGRKLAFVRPGPVLHSPDGESSRCLRKPVKCGGSLRTRSTPGPGATTIMAPSGAV